MAVFSVLGLAICNLIWKSTRRISIENACYKSCICLEINLMAKTFPFIPTSLKMTYLFFVCGILSALWTVLCCGLLLAVWTGLSFVDCSWLCGLLSTVWTALGCVDCSWLRGLFWASCGLLFFVGTARFGGFRSSKCSECIATLGSILKSQPS